MRDAIFNKLFVLYNKAVLKYKIMFLALEFAFMKKAGPKNDGFWFCFAAAKEGIELWFPAKQEVVQQQ